MRSYVRSKLMMVGLLLLFFALPVIGWQFGMSSGLLGMIRRPTTLHVRARLSAESSVSA